MPDVYRYTDYRRFLADYYCEHKSGTNGFSYQSLASRAGFSNRGFLHNVMSGGKNLSAASATKLGAALGLSGADRDYFENLVAFTQAHTARERDLYFERLNAVRTTRKGSGEVRQTRRDQYEFYARWYHAVVRSLLGMHNYGADWARLARSVHPRIRPSEAKASVQLLLRLGLVRRRSDGSCELADKSIAAGPEVVALGLSAFQRGMNELAGRAMVELPPDKRHVSGVTLGISAATYAAICTEIDAFRRRLLTLAEQDRQADNVYQVSINMFPVSDANGLLGAARRRGGRAAGTSRKRRRP